MDCPGWGAGRAGDGKLSNFERILRRGRGVDEAQLDDLRLVVMTRLAAANGAAADQLPISDQRPIVLRRANGETAGGPTGHPINGLDAPIPAPWLLVAPLEVSPAEGADAAEVDAGPDPQTEAELPESRPAMEVERDEARPGETDPTDDRPDVDLREAAHATPPSRSRQRRRHGRAAATAVPAAGRASGEPMASCPYCATVLQPAPETDDHCPRCRQPMIVRYVGTRRAILAAAVLPFFEAERLNEERRARERDRWLELARESGTDDDQLPNLAGESISEADVVVARAAYLSSVDGAFRLAQDDRRWDVAARIRYEQVAVLSRMADAPGAPSDELIGLHREGMAADLQAIGEVARDAEVRGESCCDACRVDDRRVVRVAEELASPTLPHAGCPEGLCRCRWFLTARDQELLAALLRRQMGAAALLPG